MRALVLIVFALAGCGDSSSSTADGSDTSNCNSIGQSCMPCCKGPQAGCAWNGDPQTGICEHCGNPGEICCPGAVACVMPGTTCERPPLPNDHSDSCIPCGAFAQACCATGSPCQAGLVCAPWDMMGGDMSGSCSCGAVSEPCCFGTDCRAGLVCAGGSCAPLDGGTTDAGID